MRILSRVVAAVTFAALPVVTGCTVVQHMYVGEGLSTIAYRDRQFATARDGRVGFSIDAFPTWSFAFTTTSVSRLDDADYVEPKCLTLLNGTLTQTGCRPQILGWSHAVDVGKRWRPTQTLHPIASLVVGQTGTGDSYRDSTGWVADSRTVSPYVTLTGGGEGRQCKI